ncbi:threonine aldolase, partial [Chryseobacterium sp. 2TAF14]
TYTNQIFPILGNDIIEVLSEKFEFYIWKKVNGNLSAIRLITSWNTQDEHVEEFIKTFNGEL